MDGWMTGEPIHYEPTLDLRPLTKEMPVAADPNDPSNSAIKPGYQTTQFWLTFAATAISIILVSGVFSPADPTHAQVLKYLALTGAILAQLGYTASRTIAQNTATRVAGEIAVGKMAAEAAPATLELLKDSRLQDVIKYRTPPA